MVSVELGKSHSICNWWNPMKRIFPLALEDKSFVYQFIVWEGSAEARCCCLSPLQTLDRLPLTNPEHFGTPVIGKKGNRGRRSNPMWVSSSDCASCRARIKINISGGLWCLCEEIFCTSATGSHHQLKWKIYSHLHPLINSPWGLEEESPLASPSSLITSGSCASVHAREAVWAWRGPAKYHVSFFSPFAWLKCSSGCCMLRCA